MRREIERVLKQADRDLENAAKNLTIEAYEVAAFLAEQSVEKYLKAAWVVTKAQAAPHTHALTERGDGLGVPADLRRHLADLTSDYTVSRYPDAANAVPYELYDAATARTKIDNARAVIEWLRRTIHG